MGDGGFAFNVTDVKTTMATVEVYPADKEMTYVAFSVAKEYMDGFESEEEFFLDDLEYMQSMADNAGVSLSTFLSEQALRTGDSGPIEFRNLKQATDYYVYAYGLTSLGIKTTPISRQVFRTSAPGAVPEKIAPEVGMRIKIKCRTTAARHFIFQCAVLTVQNLPESSAC